MHWLSMCLLVIRTCSNRERHVHDSCGLVALRYEHDLESPLPNLVARLNKTLGRVERRARRYTITRYTTRKTCTSTKHGLVSHVLPIVQYAHTNEHDSSLNFQLSVEDRECASKDAIVTRCDEADRPKSRRHLSFIQTPHALTQC